MRDQFDDCIFCGGPNGSGEHTLLAALGGLRTDRRIVCDSCNGGFSDLDGSLAADMRPINALIGVHHGRTKEPLHAVAEDAETGRAYELSRGRQLRHTEPLVIEDRVKDGTRSRFVVASSEKQAEDFVRKVKAEGKPFTVVARERVPLLFASTPVVYWGFGGERTFRAVARAALNIFAHHFPIRAREPWLAPFKQFILEGGACDEWVRYEYDLHDEPRVPQESFPFQHRFLIGCDAQSGLTYARVSLLGVVELAVQFGRTQVQQSETLVHDVNVLATSAPGDVRVSRVDGCALIPPVAETTDPIPSVQRRLQALTSKRADWIWKQDAPGLVTALNEARTLPVQQRHSRIVQALDGQQQRLLNLAVFVAKDLRTLLVSQFGDQGADVADAFGMLVQADGASRTGVTAITAAHAEMLRFSMADHLLTILEQRDIGADELWSVLHGGPGAAVVGRHMMSELEKVHPLLGGG